MDLPSQLANALHHRYRVEREQARRRTAARAAIERGESGNPYWRGAAQLNTVGYFTTAAGA